jgi:hypothetical protein
MLDFGRRYKHSSLNGTELILTANCFIAQALLFNFIDREEDKSGAGVGAGAQQPDPERVLLPLLYKLFSCVYYCQSLLL